MGLIDDMMFAIIWRHGPSQIYILQGAVLRRVPSQIYILQGAVLRLVPSQIYILRGAVQRRVPLAECFAVSRNCRAPCLRHLPVGFVVLMNAKIVL